MKRFIIAGMVVGPMLCVIAGLYSLLFTPNTVTAYTAYSYSSTGGFMLVFIGLLLLLIGGILAYMMLDD